MQAPEAGGRHKTTPTPHKHSSFVYNTVRSQPGRQDGWTDGRLFLLKRVHTLEDPHPSPRIQVKERAFFLERETIAHNSRASEEAVPASQAP